MEVALIAVVASVGCDSGATPILPDAAQPDATEIDAAPEILTIADVQMPRVDPACDPLITLFAHSMFEGRYVAIDVTPTGKLVVTGKFAQFYTVADTGVSMWNSLEVDSGAAPPVNVGDVLRPKTLTGTINEVNGMTELMLPLADVASSGERLPAPTVLTIADFSFGTDMTRARGLEALEAAIVELQDGCICPPGPDYDVFQQWSVAFRPNGGALYNCGRAYSMTVTTAGQVPGWDPPKVGHHLSSIRGALVNVAGCTSPSGASYSFFILHPRDTSDIVDAGDTCQTQ